MNIQQITKELQALAKVDAKDQAAREARDIKRAELCHGALREDAYKEIAKTISEYAKMVGLTRAYIYNLANVWDFEPTREHLGALGPAKAIAIAQEVKNGLDPEIAEAIVENAPAMKVKDLKEQLKVEMEVPDESKDRKALMKELEEEEKKKRNLEKRLEETKERIKELRELLKS